MNDSINKAEVLAKFRKKAIDEEYKRYEIESIINSMPTVKALTIDEIAEIMGATHGCPVVTIPLKRCIECDALAEAVINCWKEFFEHYAEGEE